ncbi:DUF3592 domain-containing protein [Maribacter algarum]|uniref:DUF3592 domain-containing protein n=1 Tax=Maribacter algarum (ex Zhang et al. 2020) TaxID=2578118 RepID=A0A5S3PUX1_9FLAO|nr:DUF3592 domain-containing protein [Maribacter algarum]TMM58799.1 DUF3592 domain-containing protein [Maribacter algarum]
MIQYLYWALFAGGMVSLYFAMRSYNNTRDLLSTGIKTTATVVEMITVSGSDGSTYKPVFEFADRQQEVRRYESDISSNPPAYKVGEKVKIVYDEKDDDEVKTISFWGLYRWCIVLLCIASPLLIIGGGYLLYMRN